MTKLKPAHFILIILGLLFLNFSADAQADKVVKRKVVIHSPAVEEEISDYPRWALKINPILISIGDFPISLEYAITDWLSSEVAVGLTTTNYIYDQIYSNNIVEELESKMVPGMSFMGNIKLIPSADIFDDASYFALQFSSRTYRRKYTVEGNKSLSGVPEDMETSRNIQDFGFIYGIYQTTDIDNIFLEYYLGLSLRKISGVRMENATPSGASLYYTGPDDTFNTYGILAGFKVGYLF